MKPCNDILQNELLSNIYFQCCDLFTLALTDGTVLYIADYDKDIRYKNNVYQHDRFIIKRDQIEQTGTPSVDSLSVTIYADLEHEKDRINDKYILKMAHDGLLDDAQLTLRRAFLDDAGEVLDVIDMFVGNCDVSSCGGLECKLTVKSEVLGLNANIPVRIFAAQNAYMQNEDGIIISTENDKGTLMTPLKPSQNVLLRF